MNRIFLLSILLLLSCNSGSRHDYNDTPVLGNVSIVVDESYQPLVGVELDTFMKLYKYATIRPEYLSEAETFRQLLRNDSVRVAIVSRQLTNDEKAEFDSQKIIPRVTKVAVDAVAIVVHPDNKDTLITYQTLSKMMRGEYLAWSELPNSKTRDSIRIVFDHNGSSSARYLQERFLGKADFPANCFAVKSNKAVIDYVAQNKGAVGVVGVNWISDREDPEVEAFLKKINVVQLTAPEDTMGKEFYSPCQAYIALKKYPLTRDVYVISREGRNGLGTGFASFFAGDPGQRIVRMSGLLPATMPVRIINIR